MKVLAFDPYSTLTPGGTEHPVEFVPLETLLRESDFISVHAPATPDTRGMFNAARFAMMKPTAYFINTARGSLVDEEALVSVLQAGSIAGAAIDVYQQEPAPPDHPLRSAPRCLVTPHNAFNAVEAVEVMSQQSVAHILRLQSGSRPLTVCNPEVWTLGTLRSGP